MRSKADKAPVIRRAALSLPATLRELGFTDYEAKAYAALSTKQPATAYEIAKVAGLPRANVYAALRNLEGRGAIQPVTENPVRYVLVNPEQFFRRIQRATTGLCDGVVSTLKRTVKADESAYVWIYRGEDEVHAKLTGMIEDAREHLWLKGPVDLIEPYAGLLFDAARRDVTVRLIVFGKEVPGLRAHARIQVVPHEGDGEPHGPPSDQMLTVASDSTGMLIASYAGKVKASYARDASIVYVIETLLLHEIYLAEIHQAFGKQVDARFGRKLEKLRGKYRPRGRGRPVIAGDDQDMA
ncbi:MAG: TrmB family transcriptional regulator [Burkholderiales bacterium]